MAMDDLSERYALIVTDDVPLSHEIQHTLELDGFMTFLAGCRADTETLTVHRRFALILIDLDLPDGGGLDLVARLRAGPATDTAIILMIRHDEGNQKVARALTAGADECIRIPWEGAEFRTTVRTVVRLRAAEARARRHADEMEAIARAGTAISSAADLHTALRGLLEGAGLVTGSQMGVVRLLSADGTTPGSHVRVYRRIGGDRFVWEDETLVPGSNTARVLATGESIYARDLAAEVEAGNELAAHGLAVYGVRSSLNVPLRVSGRAIGTLHVDSQQSDAFHEAHLVPLQLLADYASGAIERIRLLAAAEESAIAARHAAASFEDVLRAATDYSIVGTDSRGRVTLFNSGAELMLGYLAKDVVGRSALFMFDPAEVAARATELHVEPGLDAVAWRAKQGKAETREWTFVRADGSTLMVQLTLSPKYTSDGTLSGYIGIARDSTAQKQAEADVRSVTSVARCLLWHANVEDQQGSLVWSLTVSDVHAAQGLMHLNLLPGQTYADAWLESRLPEDRPRANAMAESALRAGRWNYSQDFRCRASDGSVIWMSEDVHIQPLSPGTWRLTGVCIDATERKQAEATLERQYHEARQMQSEMRAILDASGEAMVVVSPEGRLVTVNRSFLELFDVDTTSVVGRTVQELPSDLLRGELTRIFASGAADACAENSAPSPTADDSPSSVVTQEWPVRRELAVCSSLVRIATATSSEAMSHLYVLRDVTHERAVDRMKTEFVSLVSHELRTPLTSIKGYVDLLLDGEAGELSEEQCEFLTIVQNNSSRLVALINDLLDASRIESGRMDLHRVALHLPSLLPDSVHALRPQIVAKQQLLTVDVSDTFPAVYADATRTTQILTNLLSNAHKYTPAGGAITIVARVVADVARISIQDSGIGLTSEDQANLFTRFFRARNDTTQQVSGTGLGLAITRSLVELQGGTISVVSEPGRGATFSFTLPLADTPASLHEDTHDPAPAEKPQSGSILVVEDEPDLAALIGRYLEGAGYGVVYASGGTEALQVARTHQPDLITLDIRLGDTNGMTVLEWLKHDVTTARIPVLLISMLEDTGRGRDLGAVDHLMKPVSRHDLIERVGAILAAGSRDEPESALLVSGNER